MRKYQNDEIVYVNSYGHWQEPCKVLGCMPKASIKGYDIYILESIEYRYVFTVVEYYIYDTMEGARLSHI